MSKETERNQRYFNRICSRISGLFEDFFRRLFSKKSFAYGLLKPLHKGRTISKSRNYEMQFTW